MSDHEVVPIGVTSLASILLMVVTGIAVKFIWPLMGMPVRMGG